MTLTLTSITAKRIINLWITTKMRQCDIAATCNCSPTYVSNVIRAWTIRHGHQDRPVPAPPSTKPVTERQVMLAYFDPAISSPVNIARELGTDINRILAILDAKGLPYRKRQEDAEP